MVSVRENDHVGNSDELAVTGTKPEEIPTTFGVTEVFVNCVHGSGKLDCVTVWFFDVLKEANYISFGSAISGR